MTADELIKLIPSETFRKLAIETKVDVQVKKLSGEVIFKLILFSMLNSDKLSLRVMETYLQSAQFKAFSQFDILDGKYNSIRDRICSINYKYFEELFKTIFSIYNKELKEEKALSRTDSTCVALAARLLTNGIEMGNESTKFVKYTVNLKGSLPSSVKVFTDQRYASEEHALKELIEVSDCSEADIVVFDRGIRSRATFDKFTGKGKLFVCRAELSTRYKVCQSNVVPAKPEESSVTIISDEIGILTSKRNGDTNHRYRIIKATIDNSGQLIFFITNVFDEDPYTIAAWYKQRWDIEVFFKFIKQHLNVKHLVSRDNNGIKVMIYMTMILATLLIAYKKINKIKGFKIAKLKFELELEKEIIKTIVILCGGDPSKAPYYFNSA